MPDTPRILRENNIGAVFILTAATCWGLAGGIGGVLVERGWDPIVVSFYRGSLTLVFAVLWLLVSSDRRGFWSWRLWVWSAMAGAGVAGAFSFYFTGMRLGSVAIAATLLYSAPVFVFIAEYLSGYRRPTLASVVGLVFVLVGVALLSGVFTQTMGRLTGAVIVVGLLSGVCYAIFILGFQRAAAHGSTQVVMSAAFTVQTALLAAVSGAEVKLEIIEPFDVALILSLGILGGGVSFLCYILGLRRSSAGSAALLGMAEPLTAAAFGFVILGQYLTPWQLLGATVVILTISILNRHQ